MSNDSTPVGGARGFDSEALEEWVTETARQKGVSKQKLLDEILSSYWVLEELSGVVSDSSVSADSQAADDGPSVEPTAATDPATARGSTSSTSPVVDHPKADEFSELKSELQDLRGAIEELSGESAADDDTAADAEFSALESQLDDLSSAVVDRQTETDDTVETLVDRLEEFETRLHGLETQLNAGMSLAELRNAVGENSSGRANLEARIESEFDSIEQVLQHLLDTTDNIEYRLGAVSDSRQEALEPLKSRNELRDALADLKKEAIRHDISAAVCDHCEQSIDLGLLERPECPSCEHRFTGISKGSWLPFSKPQLKTTDRPHDSHTHTKWTTTNQPSPSTSDDRRRTDW